MKNGNAYPVVAPLASSQDAAVKIGHYRWTICALLFFATTMNYVDRQVVGLLAPVLQKSIGWNEVQYGYIVAAFQAAYAVGLLLMARLMDWIGARADPIHQSSLEQQPHRISRLKCSDDISVL